MSFKMSMCTLLSKLDATHSRTRDNETWIGLELFSFWILDIVCSLSGQRTHHKS